MVSGNVGIVKTWLRFKHKRSSTSIGKAEISCGIAHVGESYVVTAIKLVQEKGRNLSLIVL